MAYVEHEGFGHFEVFEVDDDMVRESEAVTEDGDGVAEGRWTKGWYYWSCQPGCLPDGDPTGPFDSEALAEEALDEEYQEWRAS